jgi:hypothetical protein
MIEKKENTFLAITPGKSCPNEDQAKVNGNPLLKISLATKP